MNYDKITKASEAYLALNNAEQLEFQKQIAPRKIGYDDLTMIYRTEQRTKNPSEVRKDLYLVIRHTLRGLREEAKQEFAKDQFSSQAKLAADYLAKFEDKVKHVLEFRLEKVMMMSIRGAMGYTVDISRLTDEEVDAFNWTAEMLKKRPIKQMGVE